MPIQARTEFAAALNQLASEKGVDVNVVVEAIQQAALAAYRKDLSLRGEEVPEDFDDLTAEIDPSSGEISIKRGSKNITPPGFARIAAQTAKQVIMQRLHEAEKSAVMEEYEQKVGTLVSGTMQRQEGNTYFVDLGRAEGVFPISEQTRDEYYHAGQRLKFLIKEIREGRRGLEVIVSRADPALVKGLFALEVPEIQAGTVVVKEIAREAGSRTKIAAISTQEGVDPVGSLVGQKGVRVQAVMNELGEERIDIIPYSEDPAKFIASALSPAKDVQVKISEENGEKVAKVKVPTSQLSLAIGRGGQNVRLAAKLTGWKIDIEGTGEDKEATVAAVSDTPAADLTDEDKQSLTSDEDKQSLTSDEDKQSLTSDEDKAGKAREEVVEAVEEEIDKAVAEESQNGVVPQEPSAEEVAEAAVAAEADMAADDRGKLEEELGSMDETADAQRGDLIGDREPSEAETAPALDEETKEELNEDQVKEVNTEEK